MVDIPADIKIARFRGTVLRPILDGFDLNEAMDVEVVRNLTVTLTPNLASEWVKHLPSGTLLNIKPVKFIGGPRGALVNEKTRRPFAEIIATDNTVIPAFEYAVEVTGDGVEPWRGKLLAPGGSTRELVDVAQQPMDEPVAIAEWLAAVEAVTALTGESREHREAAEIAASSSATSRAAAEAAASRAEDAATGFSIGTVTEGSAWAFDVTGPPAERHLNVTTAPGPRGEQGAPGPVPDISVTVETSAAGTDAAVSLSGTPDAPVVHFTIPRGATGLASDMIDDTQVSLETTHSSQRIADDLAGKAATSHTHEASEITGGQFLPGRLPKATAEARGAGLVATAEQMTAATGAVSGTPLFVTPERLDLWHAAQHPQRKRVVFVGSSTSLASTWPSQLMGMMDWTAAAGWTATNVAVADAGFADSTGSFLSQVDNAYTMLGAAAAAEVGFVFITDAGGDVRSLLAPSTLRSRVATTMQRARTRFPNARVVVIPLIWPASQTDYTPDALAANASGWPSTMRAQLEWLTYEVRAWRCELVDQSWTWLTGRQSYMSALKSPLPGAAGYQEIARWVAAYLRGESTKSSIGWREVELVDASYYSLPDATETQRLGAYADGWDATVIGAVKARAATGPASDFARLPYALRPALPQVVTGYAVGRDQAAVPVVLRPDGLVRASTTIAGASTLYISGSYSLN